MNRHIPGGKSAVSQLFVSFFIFSQRAPPAMRWFCRHFVSFIGSQSEKATSSYLHSIWQIRKIKNLRKCQWSNWWSKLFIQIRKTYLHLLHFLDTLGACNHIPLPLVLEALQNRFPIWKYIEELRIPLTHSRVYSPSCHQKRVPRPQFTRGRKRITKFQNVFSPSWLSKQ